MKRLNFRTLTLSAKLYIEEIEIAALLAWLEQNKE